MNTMSLEEWRKAKKTSKPSKYHNKKTVVDGIVFDSKKEAKRYEDLKLLEKAGKIQDLKLQVPYLIEVNGIKICNYVSDFEYFENGRRITEDCKGMKTGVYILKKKLFYACFQREILET